VKQFYSIETIYKKFETCQININNKSNIKKEIKLI